MSFILKRYEQFFFFQIFLFFKLDATGQVFSEKSWHSDIIIRIKIRVIYLLYLCAQVCACVSLCAPYVCRSTQKSEDGIGSLGTRAVGCCELLSERSGN